MTFLRKEIKDGMIEKIRYSMKGKKCTAKREV